MKREGDPPFLPNPTVERQVRVLKPYEAEDAPEMMRAKTYWRERLHGEDRIETPMHPDCKLSIVVPVFNEDVRRLSRQLISFHKQTAIKPTEFEIVYVINNDEDDGTERALKIRAKNIHAAAYLRQDHGMAVHVIDKSSPGMTIASCNVGKARNRGVAEAGVRFYEQGKNGILLQTDADTWFEDPRHLAKICQAMEGDPRIIGIAGGLNYEWDPDAEDPTERQLLMSKLAEFKRLKQFKLLREFIAGRKPDERPRFSDKRFTGAHMISRSLEVAMIGGLKDLDHGSDPLFGRALYGFADTHGQEILSLRQALYVTTALRESDRTGASFKKIFDQLDVGKYVAVPDIRPEAGMETFRHGLYGRVKGAFMRRDERDLRTAISNRAGESLIPDEALSNLLTRMKRNEFKRFTELMTAFNKAYTGKKTLVEMLYEDQLQMIGLTPEYLDELKHLARTRPGGDAFVRQMEAHYSGIRLNVDELVG